MSESDEYCSETESLSMEWGPTSEEEDMPPELEEAEGGDKDEDSTEVDNKREEEVDMVAEFCKRVPAQFFKKESPSCGANHSWIKVGHSWTSHAVIQETHKMTINEVIHKWYGEKVETKEALSVYQNVVHRVVKQLTEEEWEEAENTATEWKLDCRPPNDIKARLLLWWAGHKRMETFSLACLSFLFF
ncbi:hypothetical protein BS17DRAFT_763595 [Gyrodon lividus]|nr:hypothetical protein BS17DRAFT_763595 [Gyrodon lividus]